MKIFDVVTNFASKNSSILICVGSLVGLGLTAYAAYKCRPAVDKIVEEKKKCREDIQNSEILSDEEKEKASKEITKETVKEMAPVVAPTVVAFTLTAALVIGGAVIHSHKVAELTAGLLASERAYDKLSQKTKDIVGEEKAAEIEKEVIDADLRDIVCEIDCIEQGKGGDQVFYDPIYGRLFKSDVNSIRETCKSLEWRMTCGKEEYMSMNDFYREMNLETTIGGNDRGWCKTSMEACIEPNMSNAEIRGDISVIILDWYTRPKTNYAR